MAIKATINTTTGNRVSVNAKEQKSVRTVAIGPSTNALRLDDLVDVDATGSNEGEVLIYDENQGKYLIGPITRVDGGRI